MTYPFDRSLTGKVLCTFFICGLQFGSQAQTIHPKSTATKVQPQPQKAPEPVNPYTVIDKRALLIPDSSTKSTTAIASYINSNFQSNEDKVRAVFIWIATNIKYDVPNMYVINYYEKQEDKIAKPLQTRQGICENYAALFTDICVKLGIPAFVVQGYVKQNNQVLNISHAWSVAKIDTGWYLFDPTWAAGYASNGAFVAKLNNSYYKTNPSDFMNEHMPFDPLWQLSYHPASYADFNNGPVKEDAGKPYFNFPDSIALYEKQNEIERNQSAYNRMDNNGSRNAQVFNMMLYLRQEIEQAKIDQYNTAVAYLNDAVNNFNDFIRYRNKQFTPMRPDAEIQAMLDSASNPFSLAKATLDKIKDPGPNITNTLGSMHRQMKDFYDQLEEQQVWLAKYFSKGKSGRRSMFYTKLNFFGKPVNQ
ncbi:MAG TPA: transglutaminase domain-containing protein [Puia sp.]|jgi:transglutaminase/protease-like cytokinesis protein 3|nr:transglutaminase domain-containing protein [Puia sp.]